MTAQAANKSNSGNMTMAEGFGAIRGMDQVIKGTPFTLNSVLRTVQRLNQESHFLGTQPTSTLMTRYSALRVWGF